MVVEVSRYLKSIKPTMKKLLEILNEDFNYVSILGTDSEGKRYGVGRTMTVVAPSMMNERGFVVRVHNGVNYSEYSFNELNEENILEVANEIKNNLINAARTMDEGNRIKEYELLIEEEISKSECFDIEEHPKIVGDEKIISMLTDLSKRAFELSDEMIECRANYEFLHISKIFLSTKKELEQGIVWSNAGVMCMASRNGVNKYSHKGKSGAMGTEIFEELKGVVEKVVPATIELLESEPMIPGEYDVICTPEVTGLIAHEAFGHGVEMDMVLKNRAKSSEFFGEYVASPLVTMIDGAASIAHTGSYMFDDEGQAAGDTVVIEKGILKEGMNDALTAMALGKNFTGNGRRESYERKAYTRMTNTFFMPGESTVEEMMESIEYGFLIDTGMSGMEDPKNWGIQCMLNVAREIKNGKLTGKVYSPIILTGYVPDLLKSISMVSNELSCEGSGYCGKGYKEWAKVSAGGPHIKCKARLG
ncbi:MAG: TldD/PmbA family protein [Clostridium sp.]